MTSNFARANKKNIVIPLPFFNILSVDCISNIKPVILMAAPVMEIIQ
jgi:hypothetical protein